MSCTLFKINILPKQTYFKTFIFSHVMKKSFQLLLLFQWFLFALTAQIPLNYYSSATGKSNAELKTSLHLIIKVGTRLGYGSGSGKTWSGFEKSDLHPDGYVWDMYSLEKRYFPGNAGVPGGMNIEHSVAKSWWGGANNDAYKDLYHLNPSDSKANSARGSWPLGINNGGTFNNGAIKVGNNTFGTEYTAMCFEPLDEYKGDFARAYLYMFTCYENFNWTGTSAPTMIVANQTWPMLRPWAKDLLLQWSKQDPVSSKELNRAAEIFKIQNNRNPYIDHPELLEYLWGNMQGYAWSPEGGDYPILNYPLYGTTLDFGTVAYTQTDTASIFIKASKLEGDVNLSIIGTNASNFILPVNTITKSLAEEGYKLIITYNAQDIGNQTAKLVISGGGLQVVEIPMNAVSEDGFLALPATHVSSTSFNANWTVSGTANSYLLDVYTKTITGNGSPENILEADFNGSIPSGWSTSGYTDVQTEGFIRLASGNNPGEISSPTIDLSTQGKKLIVNAKRFGSDSEAVLNVKVDGQALAAWTTTSSVQEFSVDLPKANVNSVISFSAAKNRRVYIENIMVETLGSTVTHISLSGYPVNVGNVLTYKVDNVESDSAYFYQISSVGNTTIPSNEIQVKTLVLSSNENLNMNNPIYYYSTDDGIYISRLPSNAVITVYNMIGNQIQKVQTSTSDIELKLSQKGIYLIQIISKNERKVFKIRN